MCGIVWTPRCGVWTRAPTPAGVAGWRGLTSGARWPGAAESARLLGGCERRRPHRGVDRRRRSEAAPGAGRVCAGWGRRGRAACVPAATRRGGGHGGRARVSGPWVVPGPGTEWRTRVPPRAPGMLLGEEPPPLPPLPRCNALLPVYGACAAARPGRIVDAGIYEALGKTGALEGRHR